MRGATFPERPGPLTLSLSRTGEGTRVRSFQVGAGGAPQSPLPFGRGRVGEADRVRGATSPERPDPSPCPSPERERGPAPDRFRPAQAEPAPHLSRSGEVECASAHRVRGATSPERPGPLTLSLSRTGEGTCATTFQASAGGAGAHLSRSGEVECASAHRVRGATFPDRANPSPCPSPERERGPAPDRSRSAQAEPAPTSPVRERSSRRQPTG